MTYPLSNSIILTKLFATLHRKKKKSLKKILNKIEPTAEPCATPDAIV